MTVVGSAAAKDEAAHWGYEGHAGPEHWGELKPEFATCKIGRLQSPIDIKGAVAADVEPITFGYKPAPLRIIDNGHTVQVNVPPGSTITAGGRSYELAQFHFHRPSEEKIDKTPTTVSAAQVDRFAKIYRNNARPVQPLNDRPIKMSK